MQQPQEADENVQKICRDHGLSNEAKQIVEVVLEIVRGADKADKGKKN